MIDIKPLAGMLEYGAEKYNGFVMKLNLTGFLFELDEVNFRVGSIMKITLTLDDGPTIQESVRSIKHYDRFFRNPPKKPVKGAEAEPQPEPKRLVEAHFVQLKEDNRKALMKYLMSLTLQEMKKRK